jgi:hypothetical protein
LHGFSEIADFFGEFEALSSGECLRFAWARDKMHLLSKNLLSMKAKRTRRKEIYSYEKEPIALDLLRRVAHLLWRWHLYQQHSRGNLRDSHNLFLCLF